MCVYVWKRVVAAIGVHPFLQTCEGGGKRAIVVTCFEPV